MEINEKESVSQAIIGLNQAIGASSQLIHQHGKLAFIDVRNSLVAIKDAMIVLAIEPMFKARM